MATHQHFRSGLPAHSAMMKGEAEGRGAVQHLPAAHEGLDAPPRSTKAAPAMIWKKRARNP